MSPTIARLVGTGVAVVVLGLVVYVEHLRRRIAWLESMLVRGRRG